jgi:hypothetical protein
MARFKYTDNSQGQFIRKSGLITRRSAAAERNHGMKMFGIKPEIVGDILNSV